MEKFNYEENGYNRREVNQFVQDVIKSTEGIMNAYRDQLAKIEKLERELKTYHQMEDTLKKAIMNAEVTGDNIKRMAREEASMTVTDAKHNASRIVNEALMKAEKIEQQADLLERNMRIFKRKLKAVIAQQEAVIDEIEKIELR